ncbi:Tyrosine recombinase XerC [Acholeplasma oculi]|uniref:Integrase n=1 Tax=Acholeplasma oculi TaxID=35623 RepID=A0A061AA06_9MOLU|nr:tyrosine-type recombinase/integrase [Acholeplasma oculi]CDR30204.1 Integrase [Acholeplasma oculi]SKC43994.1 integrase/recombinase XerC [Acholeplasma oculi]SUT88573.1 Tyrosine recombinase XerC [Acholeplasma oculi]
MTIIELTNKHLNKISLELSKGTYEHYKSHYQHFINYCKANDIIKAEDITEENLSRYIREMKNKCSNRTINMRIGNLQRCFKTFGIRFEYLESLPKLKQRLITYDFIDLPDIRRMRSYFYALPETEENLFQVATFLILMETGCRRSELLNIQKNNIDFKNNMIIFTTTKTDEDRMVPFKEKTATILWKLYNQKHDHKFLLHNPLKNRPINKDDLEYMMRKYKSIFGLNKLHAHMFRHSFATHFIEAGADRKTVQSMTGHRDAKSLDRYVHVRRDFVLKTYHDKFILD